MPGLLFADAGSTLDDSDFVIFGVPFDKTSSFRAGAAEAPDAIREASHNFETYKFEHGEDIESIKFCDLGNLEEFENVDLMMRGVGAFSKDLVDKGKFPIALGGEHSMSPAIIKSFEGIGVISLDAHLDFRNEYEGQKNSHACSTRRISEVVGVENVVPIGVRSMSKEENIAAEELGLRFISSFAFHQESNMEDTVDKALKWIDMDRIYLTLDMDVFDPAYAPGISNPEPFGLEPIEIKRCINHLAGKLAGFDVVEVSPPYDNGNTSALAARLVREVIMAVWKAQM
jgi:agmatinase